MHAMVLNKVGSALEWTELPDRQPGPGEIRIKVSACGVCRTDLHVVDGELPHPRVPIIPGHEIVGRIDAIGTGVTGSVAIGWRSIDVRSHGRRCRAVDSPAPSALRFPDCPALRQAVTMEGRGVHRRCHMTGPWQGTYGFYRS